METLNGIMLYKMSFLSIRSAVIFSAATSPFYKNVFYPAPISLATMAEKGLPSFRDSEFPRFRVSEFPSFRDSEFPRFRVSEIPSFRVSEFPRLDVSQRDLEFWK